MKKILVLIAVALAAGSASLFALPGAGVQGEFQPFQFAQAVKTRDAKADVSEGVLAAALARIAGSAEDDLFAEVQAVSLTDEEARAVEGEGPWGAFFGGIIGAVIGGIAGGADGAKAGAAIGLAIGAAFPPF